MKWRKHLTQHIYIGLRAVIAAWSELRELQVHVYGEQGSVAGSSNSGHSIQQSLLQLDASVENFAAAFQLAGEVAGAAAGAEAAAAEYRTTADELSQRCTTGVESSPMMGLSGDSPRTPEEQRWLQADSAFSRVRVQEDCCQHVAHVQSSLADLQQHVAPLALKLQQWAAGLCGQFVLACCCNNAGCINMLMPSEQELVGGKQCVCARCRCATFCSRECQVAMWPYHKKLCKKLKRQQQRGEGGSVDAPATPT
jgi:hypothetical protein